MAVITISREFACGGRIFAQKLDDRAAQEYVEREDREKAGYIEHYFNRSVNDPHLYHMLLNLSRIKETEERRISFNRFAAEPFVSNLALRARFSISK